MFCDVYQLQKVVDNNSKSQRLLNRNKYTLTDDVANLQVVEGKRAEVMLVYLGLFILDIICVQ